MAERAKREQLLAYLMDKKTPSLVLYLARKTKNAEGKFFDAALYPLSPWQPKTGYEVDQALVLAWFAKNPVLIPMRSVQQGQGA
jgi:hypothetical protein